MRQILIKSVQNHPLNAIGIMDRKTGKYIKPSFTFITNSRNSLNHNYIQQFK